MGLVPLQVPRDRAGTFEPLLIPKRVGWIAGGLGDMVISLYASGLTCADIADELTIPSSCSRRKPGKSSIISIHPRIEFLDKSSSCHYPP